MAAWLASTWSSIWPNLAANILWIPLVGVHHVLLRRHVARLHHQHTARIERAINERKDPA